MRLLEAPKAERTAISLARLEARASSRLATFKQQMSRTNPAPAEQGDQGRPHLANGIALQRREIEAEVFRVKHGVQATDLAGDLIQVRLGLIRHDAWFEARNQAKEVQVSRTLGEIISEWHHGADLGGYIAGEVQAKIRRQNYPPRWRYRR